MKNVVYLLGASKYYRKVKDGSLEQQQKINLGKNVIKKVQDQKKGQQHTPIILTPKDTEAGKLLQFEATCTDEIICHASMSSHPVLTIKLSPTGKLTQSGPLQKPRNGKAS